MSIQLSEHFDYKKLIRFTLPTIAMMIFTSIYGIVDGVFVSNFGGKTAFAAVNLILPFVMIFGTIGFMVGQGGSALIAKTMGEGNAAKANRYFSMLIEVTLAASLLLTVIGYAFTPWAAGMLGATGQMLSDCVVYGRLVMLCTAPFVLQNVFQSFMITAERPQLGFYLTLASGVTNIVLDAVFVGGFRWGLVGAALATDIASVIGGVIPLFYFARENSSPLRLKMVKPELRPVLRACGNGSSEMVSNLSLSLVNMLYNMQLMRLAGENGVAAYGVIMYAEFIFMAVFFGYCTGVAPVMGFHYGAQNTGEMKNLFRRSLVIVLSSGVLMIAAACVFARPVVGVFVGYDKELLDMSVRAFRLFALCFVCMGVNIYASSTFTALNDGAISAAISFARTLLFQVAAVLVLPALLGLDGVWLSELAAESAACAVAVSFLAAQRKKYGYA